MPYLLTGAVLFFGLISSASARCYHDDRQTKVTTDVDAIRCTTHGYCRAYGYNPDTRRYEYYYGYHNNCPGYRQRTVTTYHCLNSLGIGYTVERYGPWGSCRVQ